MTHHFTLPIRTALVLLILFVFATTSAAQTGNQIDTTDVRSLYEAGSRLHDAGNYSMAQKFYFRAYNLAQKLPDDDPYKNQHLALIYELYGDNYYTWKVWGENSVLNYANARIYYREAGHYWYLLYGKNNLYTARIFNKMASCWLQIENPDSAAVCIDEALLAIQNTPDINPQQQDYITLQEGLSRTCLDLVEHYYSVRNYPKTMDYLQKMLAVEKQLSGEDSDVYKLVLHQIDLLKQEMAEPKKE
ncbi:MAG: hypothetical protein IK023_06900 [Bacteroidaceae bacterium]|nr:hypothetical protein [Bacteroidaceae bacterium]